jgi:hypothetical protein
VTVSYTPQFTHTDWVDNVDRVRAAGDNGFNVRFRALEAEFRALAEVMGSVGAALEALAQHPPATPVKLTLTPTLVPISDPWDHTDGAAAKPPGAEAANGMMAVSLPQGVRITQFRVIGEKEVGSLSVSLRRQSLAPGSTSVPIVEQNPGIGAFDVPLPAPAGPMSTVDNDQFRYFVQATLDSSDGAADVRLTCFQITYIGP